MYIGLCWGYVGIMEKKMETTDVVEGFGLLILTCSREGRFYLPMLLLMLQSAACLS